MAILLPGLAWLLQIGQAALGSYVSVKSVRSEHHKWLIGTFILMAILGIGVNTIQQQQSDAQLADIQKGVREFKPPTVEVQVPPPTIIQSPPGDNQLTNDLARETITRQNAEIGSLKAALKDAIDKQAFKLAGPVAEQYDEVIRPDRRWQTTWKDENGLFKFKVELQPTNPPSEVMALSVTLIDPAGRTAASGMYRPVRIEAR